MALKFGPFDGDGFLISLKAFLDGTPPPDGRASLELATVKIAFRRGYDLDARIAEMLASAAGRDWQWREAIGQAGVLDLITKRLVELTSIEVSGVYLAALTQFLRLLGNSVIDHDENRSQVMLSLPTLTWALNSRSVNAIALGVLYNLLNDFEPAKKKAAEMRLDETISTWLLSMTQSPNIFDKSNWEQEIARYMRKEPSEILDADQLSETKYSLQSAKDFLGPDAPDEDMYSRALEIINWTSEFLTDEQIQDKATLKILHAIVDIANRIPPSELLKEAVTTVTSLLAKEAVRKLAAKPLLILRLVKLTGKYWTEIIKQDHLEDTQILELLATQLEHISCTDEFVNVYKEDLGLVCDLVDIIRSKFLASDENSLISCGCTMIGNAVLSGSTACHLVMNTGLHQTLQKILSANEEPRVLFSAAGCMRHLMMEDPLYSKESLPLIRRCCELLLQKDPSVRGEAAAIVRLLAPNRAELLVTNRIHTGDEQDTTYLEFLISQGLAATAPIPSLSRKHAPIEIGRLVFAILRNTQLHTGPGLKLDVKDAVLQTPLLIKPLSNLLCQSIVPELRSEALMGFALLAHKIPDGLPLVAAELKGNGRALGALIEAGTAKPAPNPDFSNYCLVLHGLVSSAEASLDGALKERIREAYDAAMRVQQARQPPAEDLS